jgi:hypothetical protein
MIQSTRVLYEFVELVRRGSGCRGRIEVLGATGSTTPI